MNSRSTGARKYVASTTVHDPSWANTTVLSDVATGVCALKVGGEGELNVQGSSNLLQTLELVETRANSKGAVYSVYRTAGPPATGSFAAPDVG